MNILVRANTPIEEFGQWSKRGHWRTSQGAPLPPTVYHFCPPNKKGVVSGGYRKKVLLGGAASPHREVTQPEAPSTAATTAPLGYRLLYPTYPPPPRRQSCSQQTWEGGPAQPPSPSSASYLFCPRAHLLWCAGSRWAEQHLHLPLLGHPSTKGRKKMMRSGNEKESDNAVLQSYTFLNSLI